MGLAGPSAAVAIEGLGRLCPRSRTGLWGSPGHFHNRRGFCGPCWSDETVALATYMGLAACCAKGWGHRRGLLGSESKDSWLSIREVVAVVVAHGGNSREQAFA